MFYANGQDINLSVRVLHFVKDPKPIIGAKAYFPLRTKLDRLLERFPISGLDSGFKSELLLDRLSNLVVADVRWLRRLQRRILQSLKLRLPEILMWPRSRCVMAMTIDDQHLVLPLLHVDVAVHEFARGSQ